MCKVSIYLFILIPIVVITKNKSMLRYAKKMKSNLFFTEFISITLEGYFEFLIAAYLNLTH